LRRRKLHELYSDNEIGTIEDDLTGLDLAFVNAMKKVMNGLFYLFMLNLLFTSK
jgi:hypothetical protein